MNRTRMMVTAVVALVLSVGVTFAIYRLLHKRLNPSNEMTQIVVATEKLPLGTRLGPEHLKLVSWSKNVPIEGNFSEIKDVVGRGVIVSMMPNEPVLDSKLAPVEAGAGLTTVIPEGMRALGVKVNDVVGVAGFVLPGSRVDVIVSGSSDKNNETDTAKVILENVQVLAADHNVEKDRDGKPLSVQVITLLVSPDESQRLALATVDGRIQLALRNPLDFEQANPKPVTRTVLYNGPSVATPIPVAVAQPVRKPAPKKEPPPPPPPPPVIAQVAPPPAMPLKINVELIQGNTQKTLSFEPKAEPKPDSKPDVKPDGKPEPKPEIKPEP